MNVSNNKSTRGVSLALVIGLCFARGGDRTASTTKPEVASLKSTFLDDANAGKDPFFPESIRRRVTPVHASPTNAVPQTNVLLDQIRLKGISGTKDQRLALLNYKTFAQGETGDLRVGGTNVKITCREIHDGSVLIEVSGVSELRELKLRDGLY